MYSFNEDKNSILQFDQYTPFEKFSCLCKNDIDSKLCEISKQELLILNAIDSNICKMFNTTYNYYILDDSSIIYLFHVIANDFSKICNYTTEQIIEALIINDLSNFIYRFTCAKKFSINLSTCKQLRINSWGKYFCSHLIKEQQYDSFFYLAVKKTEQIINDNKEIYSKLISLLYPYDIKHANKVNALNNKLNVKLLS